MTPKTMSSFAGGLLVAASVCGIAYFSSSSEAKSTQAEAIPSEDEMKSVLSSEGYVIFTEEEWQEQLAAIEAAAVKSREDNVEEVTETIIYRTMLSVTPGMTSIDVGEALERANIIDSAKKFFNEVEKRGVANALRPGTYEIESEMTIEEVISTIFK